MLVLGVIVGTLVGCLVFVLIVGGYGRYRRHHRTSLRYQELAEEGTEEQTTIRMNNSCLRRAMRRVCKCLCIGAERHRVNNMELTNMQPSLRLAASTSTISDHPIEMKDVPL